MTASSSAWLVLRVPRASDATVMSCVLIADGKEMVEKGESIPAVCDALVAKAPVHPPTIRTGTVDVDQEKGDVASEYRPEHLSSRANDTRGVESLTFEGMAHRIRQRSVSSNYQNVP